MKSRILIGGLTLVAALGLGSGWLIHSGRLKLGAPASPVALDDSSAQNAGQQIAKPLLGDLREVLAAFRKTIVLFADETTLKPAERDAANSVGQAIFHDALNRRAQVSAQLDKLATGGGAANLAALEQILAYIEAEPGLFDADRLAFREILKDLQGSLSRSGALPAIKLHKRVGDDLDALTEIQRNYDKEITQIFSRFETRGITLKRERWEDYVAKLRTLYTREAIMKAQGVIVPYPREKAAKEDKPHEDIFGYELPPKTVMLTFDDGPHDHYSDDIAAILKQYGIPAVFFEVGRNLGDLDKDGKAHLVARAAVSRRLLAEGHVIANHSLTHAQLSKESGDALKNEILGTDTLLKAVDAGRSPLFRFPYGARNPDGIALLKQAHLQSMLWNIDSLDWADPVPNSIADRVLRTVDKEQRGIILFHDIHERTVEALPIVLSRLVAEGYQFAIWDKGEFKIVKGSQTDTKPAVVSAGYGSSWAVVIGIDDYARWPKLQHAVRDAEAIRTALIEHFGFPPEHVVSLKNAEATRNGILAAFHDKLLHGGMKQNDRLLVFFAGHGTTRKLSSGRDLGYIVPADSDPEQVATDAIPMTEIQDISESLSARHVLFLMDACYSGLGLTRGGGNFLKDNGRRLGRQMLTAGGADQLVADGGPNGHSIFTWTLLQGLAGKADLNGDGYITATELAAFVAPAVAATSHQTPAFGSLPGSEGGEFVFELPAQTEFLNADSPQLSSEAIAANTRIDAAAPQPMPMGTAASQPVAPAPVVIKDLQGKEQKIVPPKAVPSSQRQQAQHANDQGLQHYREKRYAEAEAAFTEALKLRPDFALAANNLGFVYFKQEKYKEAAVWFQNTLKMDPSRAIAYFNLGDALARAGDAEGAKKAYQTYLELAPTSSNAGYVKEQLGKL